MKVALVCDWLTNVGGAEKVLLELHRLFPEAPIYTSQYSPKGIDWFLDADVRTGFLQIFPSRLRRFLGPLRQKYFEKLNLSEYDLIISVTGAEAKAVKSGRWLYQNGFKSANQNGVHLSYCHVPTQYYWQMYDDYVLNPGFGILNPVVRFFFKALVRPLKKADYRAAARVDQFVTISEYAGNLISKYYKREAIVVHPPVETEDFTEKKIDIYNIMKKCQEHGGFGQENKTGKSQERKELKPHNKSEKCQANSKVDRKTEKCQKVVGENPQVVENFDDFDEDMAEKPYIVTSRQVNWKRLDLAVQACRELGRPLLVIGDGPEHKNLEKLARIGVGGHGNRRGGGDNDSSSDGGKNQNGGGAPIIFLPTMPKEQLAEYLHEARGYLFPSLEPFGIAPVEALAAGCPVIAYGKGGALDYIKDGENGILFGEQTVASLKAAILKFEKQQFDRADVSRSAEKFNTARFDQEILRAVRQVVARKADGRAGLEQLAEPEESARLAEPAKPAEEPANSVKPETRAKLDFLSRVFRYLLLGLPFALLFSYHPVIRLGTSESMNFELSLTLIWLVIFDAVALVQVLREKPWRKLCKDKPRLCKAQWNSHETKLEPRETRRKLHKAKKRQILKILPILVFPLYLTLSLVWTENFLRGVLTAGVMWLAVFAVGALGLLREKLRGFSQPFIKATFAAGIFAVLWCLLQCILDVAGVSRDQTLLCAGCTSSMFGFPHPNGFSIEPQFMGNLLLFPAFLAAFLLIRKTSAYKRATLIGLFLVFSFGIFLTFSRGAIYAFLVGTAFLIGFEIVKSRRARSLVLAPFIALAFLFTLNLQGVWAEIGPTNDTYLSGMTKALNHLSLGIINFKAEQFLKNPEMNLSDSEGVDSDGKINAGKGTSLGELTSANGREPAIFNGYVAESTDTRVRLNDAALEVWRSDFRRILFGVGLGGAGEALYRQGFTETPKEIVQNQYFSLLLETGIVGIGLFVLMLAAIISFVVKSPNAELVLTLGLAYGISLLFFAGLPNALQIYLLTGLAFCSDSAKNQKASEKFSAQI